VHKTNEVKAAYARLGITPVYNIPYSPDFNGIESYFSMVKSHYKKLLLQLMIKESTFNVVDLIKESIRLVSDEKVRHCVKSGLDAVMK
jgi:transposase